MTKINSGSFQLLIWLIRTQVRNQVKQNRTNESVGGVQWVNLFYGNGVKYINIMKSMYLKKS